MPKNYKNILVEKKGAIGYLTLNRPEKLNSLNKALMAEFEEACYDFRDDPNIKVFIIKGAGRCFSAGYDMSMEEPHFKSDEAIDMWGDEVQTDNVWWRSLWDNPKISIAQVHSFCLAGGGHMLCHADILYCSDDALFGYPPVRYASLGTHLLWPTFIGLRKAMEHFVTGNMMTAETALRVGFVNEVFPRDQLEAEVEKLAKTVAKVPVWSLRLNKRAVHEFFEVMGLRTALRYSEALTSISYGSSPKAIPHGFQDINRVTVEKGMRAGFEYMNEDFIEEDRIASSQMARPDRKP